MTLNDYKFDKSTEVHVNEHLWGIFLEMLLLTGMKITELMNLSIADVCFGSYKTPGQTLRITKR